MRPEVATTPGRASLLTWSAIGLLYLTGIGASALHLTFGVFDADELQHAHIAWLIANGEVPYRDFWDHHGPLFGLVNGWVLRVSAAAPGIELLYWCRIHSALATACVVAGTWRVARALALPIAAGATAGALLLSVFFVQDKGTECRPDTWQNAFWVGGLCLLVAGLRTRRPASLGTAGLLMGLAVLTNAKAGLGPFVIVLYYLFGRRLHGLPWHAVARDLGLLAAGGLIPYVLALAYFMAQDAAASFHHFNLGWNFAAAREVAASSDRGWGYAASLLKRQLPFALAAAIGLWFWLRQLRGPQQALDPRPAWLVPILAVTGTVGIPMSFYSQYFLFLLPAWCLLAAHGLLAGAEQLARRDARLMRVAAATCAVVIVGNTALQSAWFAPWGEPPVLREQKALTARILAGTPRAEPIGVIWVDACAGFMFNAKLQYYWGAEGELGRFVAKLTGTDPFGEPFIRALEHTGTRYIVGRDAEHFHDLPSATQAYIRDRYEHHGCLWSRRPAGSR